MLFAGDDFEREYDRQNGNITGILQKKIRCDATSAKSCLCRLH